MNITKLTHSWYDHCINNWYKWRLTYEGGDRFRDTYLKQFSKREKPEDFENRKAISYTPSFAKAAINEIKNSIFSRMSDVTREGGSPAYQAAVRGDEGGVDLLGSSMTSFVGRLVLPELLTMSRVGIYIDMPVLSGNSVIETLNDRPYLYVYKAEDIQSWALDETSEENEFRSILLCDYVDKTDEETGLPIGQEKQYRLMWIAEDGFVHCRFHGEDDKQIGDDVILKITKIPFVVATISDSLLCDVSNYQIAHLNLASSDMAYALHSNFPFYVEQYDPRTEMEYLRSSGPTTPGESTDANTAKAKEIKLGASQGRRYPLGANEPAFIHPSPEPLQVSMEKQEQLKREIRLLVQLAVSNLTPTKMQSAESKGLDQQGLEAGLSYIGLELERVERTIARYWAMYEGSNHATVNYPTDYSLKTDADNWKEIESLEKLLSIVSSKTYQKAVAKRIAQLSVGRKVSAQTLANIEKEIDDAKAYTIDPKIIASDVEKGILDLETAAELRGYPPGTPQKAAMDHANRLARISKAQAEKMAARGVPDQDGDTSSGKTEKKEQKDQTKEPVPQDPMRGEGKQ